MPVFLFSSPHESWLKSIKNISTNKANWTRPFAEFMTKRWNRTTREKEQVHQELTAAMELRQRALQVALASGELVLTKEGCGGAYLLQDGNDQVAIFKPRDEEFMAPCNPRGYVCHTAIVGESSHPTRKGFRVGNGAIREVAAYILDAAYNHFSGVPTTAMMKAPVAGTWKEGSVQEFVQSKTSAEDMGTQQFTVNDVQRIAILDIRLFNTDRHAGNILLQATKDKTTKYKMIPIDHGLTLPSFHHLDGATFDWCYWPQAKYPLSPTAQEHVKSLDPHRDAQILRSLGLSEDTILTMYICTMLLKKAVALGFSLYDIGMLLQRDGLGENPTALEDLVEQACATLPLDAEAKDPRAFGKKLLKVLEPAMDLILMDYPKSKSFHHDEWKQDCARGKNEKTCIFTRLCTSAMTLSHEQFSEEDDTEEEVVLNVHRPPRLIVPEPSDKVRNLYADSPRASHEPPTLSLAEQRRRKLIGCSSLGALFLSVVVCIAMIRVLSGNEHLSALTPNQRNFMLATKAAGAKETQAYYTRDSRSAGSAGDLAMAKYIMQKALDFGFPEENVKLSEYEILLNEPISIRVGLEGAVKDLSEKYANKPSVTPFHFYSVNGTAQGKLVYAHYGRTQDYTKLRAAGVSLLGKVLLIRLGQISLAAKVELAKDTGAVAVLTYSDPADNGSMKGKTWPNGAYAPTDRAAFGSVYMGNGDPSTPDDVSVPLMERLPVDLVFSENNTRNILPQIISVPISGDLASSLLYNVQAGSEAKNIFSDFVGGLQGTTYLCGDSALDVVVENTQKYSYKKTWNVVILLEGTREADRMVLVASQRDSITSGAISPGSGNAVFIEMLRGIGNLIGQGWAPHRTLFLASVDAEDYGNVGTSEWIDKHSSNFASRAVVFLNIRDPVLGPGAISVEASSSLRTAFYYATLGIAQPETNPGDTLNPASILSNVTLHADENSDYAVSGPTSFIHGNTTLVWEDLTNAVSDSIYYYWLKNTKLTNPSAVTPNIMMPGTKHLLSPFVVRLGVPVVELSFDSGVTAIDDTTYDTLEWMKAYGDPSFTFHRAAAQLYGSIMLAFSDSVFLPYDFVEYTKDLRLGKKQLVDALQTFKPFSLNLDRLERAIAAFEKTAISINKQILQMTDEMLDVLNGQLVVDVKRARDMNNRLMMTERSFLFPEGLPGKPWMKHAIYGLSVWNDYNVTLFPGVFNALSDANHIDAKHQLHRLYLIGLMQLSRLRRAFGPVRTHAMSTTAYAMPLVDIAPLMDPKTTKRERQPVLDGMLDACKRVGFFTIPVSVLPEGLIERVYLRADQFNALPEEVKRKYHVNKVPNSRGWTPLFEEPSYVPGVISYLEGYDLAQELPVSYMERDKGLGPNVWPEELPEFKKDVQGLYDTTTNVTNALFEGFAEMLDLPRDTFRKFNTIEAQACMRLLTYPENTAPMDERNVGIAAHTDFECFTIIHQNNSGLQLTTLDGGWIDAPVMSDRLVIMVGDVLERWTNGYLKATPHRVLNTQQKRQSIVRFNGAEGKAIIAPLPQFISESNPTKFEPVTQRQHIENELNTAYGHLHATENEKSSQGQ
ncbi:N-acetylated-alpha-linked acidic dipeptidase [Thraustotheca clavata]|uniref:N-acetylated-alpha-linked acidic dipeptidase n=1 Tax=Thraustotheca clavata TaxID=74557 RepID=A0A1W0A382_9STRA|nr:N-acetylated-alpha-linked acidic dipeptidase [Thraustotheca clavata]